MLKSKVTFLSAILAISAICGAASAADKPQPKVEDVKTALQWFGHHVVHPTAKHIETAFVNTGKGIDSAVSVTFTKAIDPFASHVTDAVVRTVEFAGLRVAYGAGIYPVYEFLDSAKDQQDVVTSLGEGSKSTGSAERENFKAARQDVDGAAKTTATRFHNFYLAAVKTPTNYVWFKVTCEPDSQNVNCKAKKAKAPKELAKALQKYDAQDPAAVVQD